MIIKSVFSLTSLSPIFHWFHSQMSFISICKSFLALLFRLSREVTANSLAHERKEGTKRMIRKMRMRDENRLLFPNKEGEEGDDDEQSKLNALQRLLSSSLVSSSLSSFSQIFLALLCFQNCSLV